MDKIIEELVQRRLAAGWSQVEMAKRVGMKQPAIARIERGRTSPSLDTLRPILDALDCELKIENK